MESILTRSIGDVTVGEYFLENLIGIVIIGIIYLGLKVYSGK